MEKNQNLQRKDQDASRQSESSRMDKSGRQQNVNSNQRIGNDQRQDENPQDGSQWDNYQTRERSDRGSSDRRHEK